MKTTNQIPVNVTAESSDEVLSNASIDDLSNIIKDMTHDFSIECEDGNVIYFYKVTNGYIEDPVKGETTFTSLSREEIEEYYSEN